MKPFAYAQILGNENNPNLQGKAFFYPATTKGSWIEVSVTGLPNEAVPDSSNFYGMHIHETGDCTPHFENTGMHYNPEEAPHPNHKGDLPPLLGNEGIAYSFFYTNRFNPEEVLNRSIIIHNMPDDFKTQPAGDSGEKIGCGVIYKW